MIKQIQKRDGRIVLFKKEKIVKALEKAFLATKQGSKQIAIDLANKTIAKLNKKFKHSQVPNVEQVQDIVEQILMEQGFFKTAKAYILYRDQHRKIRETNIKLDIVDDYLKENDWRVKENSNMAYSLQGLNNHIADKVTSRYWLEKIYPEEIRQAHKKGDFHIHDLGILSVYCVGWSLEDLLLKGFGGVFGKIESSPPKHFQTALGQIVNFIFTMQGECYSKDTEVLTENGWKYFYDISVKDKVFTLNNKTNQIELQKPVKFYEFHNKNQLYNFKSKKIDLLVTANHNMIVDHYSPGVSENYKRKFVKAKDFNPNLHFIPKQAKWLGKEEEYFALPSISVKQYRHFSKKYQIIKKSAKKILMNDWLKFFGFYLAEGNVYKRTRQHKDRKKSYYEYSIRIFQNKGKAAQEFEKVLLKLPFHFRKKIANKNKITFEITNKQLFSYLNKFGKSGEKYIPVKIKGLCRAQLRILFNWLMKGDGYIGGGNIEYSTKSKVLAGDMQEIVLKLGWSANIYQRNKKNNKNSKWYDVGVSRAKHFRFASREKNIAKINYKGKVYCLEVPNHTLYVRRNGKVCWCGNSAGAQAFSSFDTYLAPFIRYDNLQYSDVKQALQEFLFNMNVPTRVGFQCPFSNITMDLIAPKNLAEQNVIISGKRQKEKYQDFQEEMDMINQSFAELMAQGDAKGRVFSFPIPTYNITKDFDWDNSKLDSIWKMTAKYGIPYFANFVSSDMSPDDARSMCCRLRVDNRKLYKRGGGLFGAAPLTGSIGVVTINMPRIGYVSKKKTEFFAKLGRLMDIARESLQIKRKILERFTQNGLYPYSKHYLEDVKKAKGKYWANHFSTIGLLGMNEALENFMNKNIASKSGHEFAIDILDFMNKKLVNYQKESKDFYNLEATPAEGSSYSLALKDKELYSDIKTAGENQPYYTNSTHLPVKYTDDIFKALELQDSLQTRYTGGTVMHAFLGEELNNGKSTKNLIKKIAQNFHLPYFSITPTFSVCPSHGYLSGEHFHCPKCVIHQPCEVYSRVVGYLRPVQQWHKGKQEEYRQRKEYIIK